MIIRPYLILFSIIISDISNYNIYFLSGKVAEVTITTKDSIIEKKSTKSIIYKSETKSLMKHLYPLYNMHETIINQNDYSIIMYKKNINQINFKETLEVFNQPGYNIFTFLDFIANRSSNLFNKDFLINRDGEYYSARLDSIDEIDNIIHLNLNLTSHNNYNAEVDKKYDIFLWALFLPNFNKEIWINKDNQKIIKCKFSNSFISLSAVLN